RWQGARQVVDERRNEREVILPVDLRLDRVGDELQALIVHGLQRLETVLAPDAPGREGGESDDADGAGEQHQPSQPISRHDLHTLGFSSAADWLARAGASYQSLKGSRASGRTSHTSRRTLANYIR